MENRLASPSPSFFSFIESMWWSKYFDECAKLSILKPYMDSDDLEIEAEKITIMYFYFRARDKLQYFLNDETWRADLA